MQTNYDYTKSQEIDIHTVDGVTLKYSLKQLLLRCSGLRSLYENGMLDLSNGLSLKFTSQEISHFLAYLDYRHALATTAANIDVVKIASFLKLDDTLLGGDMESIVYEFLEEIETLEPNALVYINEFNEKHDQISNTWQNIHYCLTHLPEMIRFKEDMMNDFRDYSQEYESDDERQIQHEEARMFERTTASLHL